MRRKKKYILITLISIFIVFSCRLFLYYSDISIGNFDLATKYHRFIHPINGSQNTYIIVKNGYMAKFNNYNVNNYTTININMDKNCEFAVSLEANATLGAQWYLLNNSYWNNFKYQGFDLIEPVSYGIKWEITCGDSNRRENMYFKPIKKGTNKLQFVYGGINPISNKPTGFHFTLNINVK
jgi:predicted secreted protein